MVYFSNSTIRKAGTPPPIPPPPGQLLHLNVSQALLDIIKGVEKKEDQEKIRQYVRDNNDTLGKLKKGDIDAKLQEYAQTVGIEVTKTVKTPPAHTPKPATKPKGAISGAGGAINPSGAPALKKITPAPGASKPEYIPKADLEKTVDDILSERIAKVTAVGDKKKDEIAKLQKRAKLIKGALSSSEINNEQITRDNIENVFNKKIVSSTTSVVGSMQEFQKKGAPAPLPQAKSSPIHAATPKPPPSVKSQTTLDPSKAAPPSGPSTPVATPPKPKDPPATPTISTEPPPLSQPSVSQTSIDDLARSVDSEAIETNSPPLSAQPEIAVREQFVQTLRTIAGQEGLANYQLNAREIRVLNGIMNGVITGEQRQAFDDIADQLERGEQVDTQVLATALAGDTPTNGFVKLIRKIVDKVKDFFSKRTLDDVVEKIGKKQSKPTLTAFESPGGAKSGKASPIKGP